MPRKNLSAAFQKSLTSEDDYLSARFAKADALLRPPPAPPPPPPEPERRETAARETVSMTRDEARLLHELRRGLLRGDVDVNKSEVMRAGLHALAAMSPEERAGLIARLERMRPGPHR